MIKWHYLKNEKPDKAGWYIVSWYFHDKAPVSDYAYWDGIEFEDSRIISYYAWATLPEPAALDRSTRSCKMSKQELWAACKFLASEIARSADNYTENELLQKRLELDSLTDI